MITIVLRSKRVVRNDCGKISNESMENKKIYIQNSFSWNIFYLCYDTVINKNKKEDYTLIGLSTMDLPLYYQAPKL